MTKLPNCLAHFELAFLSLKVEPSLAESPMEKDPLRLSEGAL